MSQFTISKEKNDDTNCERLSKIDNLTIEKNEVKAKIRDVEAKIRDVEAKLIYEQDLDQKSLLNQLLISYNSQLPGLQNQLAEYLYRERKVEEYQNLPKQQGMLVYSLFKNI